MWWYKVRLSRGFAPPSPAFPISPLIVFLPFCAASFVRAQLNSMIKDTLQSAADAWGMEVKRYEITEITPDAQISEAMDKQAAAERIRR